MQKTGLSGGSSPIGELPWPGAASDPARCTPVPDKAPGSQESYCSVHRS